MLHHYLSARPVHQAKSHARRALFYTICFELFLIPHNSMTIQDTKTKTKIDKRFQPQQTQRYELAKTVNSISIGNESMDHF